MPLGTGTLAISWSPAFANTNYSVSALPSNQIIGMVVAMADSPARGVSGCTLTLKSAGLLALLAAAGTLDITVTHD